MFRPKRESDLLIDDLVAHGEGDIWSNAYIPYRDEPVRTVAASPVYISRKDVGAIEMLQRAGEEKKARRRA